MVSTDVFSSESAVYFTLLESPFATWGENTGVSARRNCLFYDKYMNSEYLIVCTVAESVCNFDTIRTFHFVHNN